MLRTNKSKRIRSMVLRRSSVMCIICCCWDRVDLGRLTSCRTLCFQLWNSFGRQVTARTLHNAAMMGVQSLTNSKMGAGTKEKDLQKLWEKVRVLVIEEISMVSALLYNMLDFRAMLGRRVAFGVDASNYHETGCAFGRVPIVLHLGDFFQLRPTAQLSLLDDLEQKDEDGNWKYNDVPAEVQHAQSVFRSIPDVFELRGTMRFKPGDVLIEILQSMREGKSMSDDAWSKLQERCVANDSSGKLDPRLEDDHFARGYGMSIYWASLVRMMTRRTLFDARRADVPLVLLQTADSAIGLKREDVLRFMNRPNPYQTGHMHLVFPCHVGMRVRLVAKVEAARGMVQDTTGTIVGFEFHETDEDNYLRHGGGELFSPNFLPSGLWLSVDGYEGCCGSDDLLAICSEHVSDRASAEKLAKSLWFLPAEETVVQFGGTPKTDVRRCGFRVTHVNYFTSTGSQGLTLRGGTIIDCARQPEMDDENWWLHLYVMFSRVTSLADMLLIRPPPRRILELGPPRAIREQLLHFQRRVVECRDGVMGKGSWIRQ